jgi:hypothetical protein
VIVAEDQETQGDLSTRAPDDYEARYMAGEGVIYRDKIKAPKTFFALLGLPAVIQAIAFAAVMLQPHPAPLASFLAFPVSVAVLTLLAILFAVLRVTVTRREVLIQYGLFGPKIPLESIQSCESVVYDWKMYGGWGIRRGRDGSWAYNMMGDAGRAVRIAWTDAKGALTTTLVASPNPDVLARAINHARAGARPGVRVAAGASSAQGPRIATPPVASEFEAEAEAEAEAVLHEGDEKRSGSA